MIWYDMIWYDMIWYDMIWYDMIWYDMIWYDMIDGLIVFVPLCFFPWLIYSLNFAFLISAYNLGFLVLKWSNTLPSTSIQITNIHHNSIHNSIQFNSPQFKIAWSIAENDCLGPLAIQRTSWNVRYFRTRIVVWWSQKYLKMLQNISMDENISTVNAENPMVTLITWPDSF
jgi:hypothetical protein